MDGAVRLYASRQIYTKLYTNRQKHRPRKSDTKTILNTITIKNTNTNLKYKHKPKPQTLHDPINQYHHPFIVFISNMFSSDPYRMNATHLDFFVFRRLS